MGETTQEILTDRFRIVETEGAGPVRVSKWSLPKFRAILKLAAKAISDLSDKKLSPFEVVARLSGDELEAIIGHSLAKDDREKVADLTVEDALDVVKVIVEMNLSEGLVKKAQALMPLALERLGMGPKATDSTAR